MPFRLRSAALVTGLALAVAPVLSPAVAPTGALMAPAAAQSNSQPVLRIGAIPDQKPEKLNRLYPLVAGELGRQLGVKVKYVPVVDYAAAVSAFRTGDLDLVWFGGLTGVQARLQRPGAKVLAQRPQRPAPLHPAEGADQPQGQTLHLRLGELHLRPADAPVLPAAGGREAQRLRRWSAGLQWQP
jgi:ABC-type phosphate/phosphonate transport system substrate-binding protein